jgi:hypothetical protein
MAYFVETEEFDPETLTTLGTALDQAWMRVKANHLNGSAYRARTVLAQHIFAMAKQGERDPTSHRPCFYAAKTLMGRPHPANH